MAGGFPSMKLSALDVSGNPLLRFTRDGEEVLKVIETERGFVAPFAGLVL